MFFGIVLLDCEIVIPPRVAEGTLEVEAILASPFSMHRMVLLAEGNFDVRLHFEAIEHSIEQGRLF